MGRKKGSINKTTLAKKLEVATEMKTAPFKQRIKLEKKAKQEQLKAAMATLAANHSVEEEEIYAIRGGTLVPIREHMVAHIRESVKMKLHEQSMKDAQAMMLCRTEFKTAMDMSNRVEQIQQTFIRSLTDQVAMYKVAYTTLLASLSKDVVARIRPELEMKETTSRQEMACSSCELRNRYEQFADSESNRSHYPSELGSQDQRVESLTAELKKSQAQCASMNEELNSIKQENALLMTSSGNAQEVLGRQNEDLIQQNNMLINQKNDLFTQNGVLKEHIKRIGDVNQALTEVVRERDAARKLVVERESTINQMTVEANVARAQINQLRLEKGHLNARNTYYEMAFGNKLCSVEEDPLAISIRETENLSAQLRTTQETLKQRDAQMKELMMYLDQIKAASVTVPVGK